MKKIILLLVLSIALLKCNAQDKNGLATLEDLDPKENLIKPFEGRLEKIKRSYLVGDLNGDRKKDSIFASYKRVIAPDSTYQKECGQNVCYVRLQFSSEIPDMIIESFSFSVKDVGDVNNDGKDDILVFLEGNQYNWGQIRAYSYYNKHWTLLQSGNAFLSDDKDYENRIVKSGKNYYLLEDVWTKDFGEIYRKKLKIKRMFKQ
jgi:hypothetical protein